MEGVSDSGSAFRAIDGGGRLPRVFLCGVLGLVLLVPVASAQCWSETAKLTMTQGERNSRFGEAVALWGDTAVIGAPRESNNNGTWAGSAHVFDRDQGGPNGWGKVKKLVASDGTVGEAFGTSVAIHEDTLVAGARMDGVVWGVYPGAAYVFERNEGGPEAWGEAAKLVASDGENMDYFGWYVSVFADTIVVGAPYEEWNGRQSGAAYVFERNQGGPGAWGEVIKLMASDGSLGDSFGQVSIWGDTIAVGATHDNQWRGAVYLFERHLGGSNAWGELLKVTASDAVSGDLFGIVALSAESMLVGAPTDDDLGQDSGSAYVFERNLGGPNAWGEAKKLLASDGEALDHFGLSVAISGDTVTVGAPRDDVGGVNIGSAYLYQRDLGGAGAWNEIDKLAWLPSSSLGGTFGTSVSIAGQTVLVGDPLDSGGGLGAGAARIFDGTSTAVRYCTAGASGSGCRAFLMACGAPSATAASGFVVSAERVEGSGNGLFFYGSSGRQANPWGNGTSFQCVVPPVRRGGLLAGTGTSGACDGSFAQDLNARWCPTCPKPKHNPGVGAVMQAQLWYRDRLSTSNQTTSFSDAVEFAFVP